MGTDSLTGERTTSTHRIFWTYWSAGTVSSVGDAVTSVALPLVAVTALHASALEVGVLAAASWVAWLVIGLPAGVVVTRLPLRGTQVAMDLVRAAALVSLPLAGWLGSLTFVHLLLVALVISFANVVFSVGNTTFLPAIVPREELNNRNSLMSATHATTQMGGPALGGLLVQLVGAVAAVLVDAVSYLVSAVLLGRLPAREVPQPPREARVGAMIREGWHFVSRHPVVGPCTWAATAVNFACGALMALAPLYLVRVLDAPAALVGILIATEGIGALLGAAVTPRLTRTLGSARSILLAGLVGACLALLMPLGSGVTGMVMFALGNAGFATGVVILSINTRTYRQTESPPELLARVMATVRFVSWGAIPAGALAAGATAQLLGPRTALWLTAAAAFVPLVPLWLSPVRRLRDLSDHA
ncbi:MFS transporter [Nocardioides mesophilus]|uniref:MFS transporter n=1 Tax=Nocardioides mesophilus TaxID=433659 RepID=A0A7G9RGF6_9ACTN|nr:MFS transporter [Nocardioides mesophilus]QNN54681.1 MFS transporter [Nocardioides mesophilus]